MSGKVSRNDRKVKLMTEEAGNRKVAEEMAASIAKMREDKEKKASGAKEHLIGQLEVMSDKYRTANGVMSALDTFRDILGKNHWLDVQQEIDTAGKIATAMAAKAAEMAGKAKELEPAEMDRLCEGFYTEDFSEHTTSGVQMAEELMLLQLCQNVGPAAQDIVDFISTADQEIGKAVADLRDHCAKNDLDLAEILPEG